MPAQIPLFHAIHDEISRLAPTVRPASRARLALLVTGIVAAKRCILAQIAAELLALELTGASSVESIERRLRRTLSDPALTSDCYQALLPALLDWSALVRHTGQILLILDETTKRDVLHLVRISLAYRGSALPLAWALWEQNTPLPQGAYWQHLETVLLQAACLLPPDAPVVLLADRAYDIPPFIDRVTALGWHWIIRCKAKGSVRVYDQRGAEQTLSRLVPQHLSPGRRWKMRGLLFKDAGWREASIVGLWTSGEDEPLVVISDLDPRWDLLHTYERRSWTEPAFRSDKRRGWQWEDCQVQGVAHHARLLLAMAWASVLTVLAGVAAAADTLARPVRHRHFTQPQHARHSLFSLGLLRIRSWLYHHTAPLIWRLTDFPDRSWNDQWLAHQSRQIQSAPVRP
jgi:hypothetical protein